MIGIERYPNLLKPLRLGDTVFRNRMFSAPTGLLDLNSQYVPSGDWITYFERKAKGGAGCVNIGECWIDGTPSPDSTYRVIQMKDHSLNFNALGKIANNITRYGAVATLELHKTGTVRDENGEEYMLGPSEGHNPYSRRSEMRGMTEEQILQVINDYAEAAVYAKSRGFGMVSIHGGHGWFLHQFYSPAFNKRTDRWGGSVENRARLAVAVIDEIHKRCGKNYPVEIRISGSEIFEGGYDIQGGVELAKQLDGHADLIHVSVGNIFIPETEAHTHPGIFKDSACNVKYAAEIKKHVSTPVATIGGLSDPDEMEEILASGKADVCVMARGLICDPDLPVKIRSGREKEVRRCLRCFRCVHEMYQHGRLFCAINPESGKDREVSDALPLREYKRVLVAGGGIAGMEAAITAAKQGHQVMLCEKSDTLGGILLCESQVPFKKRVDEYIERQKYMIGKANIEVRLNTEVTPALVQALQPDAVICAIGAKPSLPPISGISGANVMTVDKAFASPESIKGKAMILGAGLSGLELGIYLSMLGKDVEIVEKAGAELGAKNATQMVKLKECGKDVHFGHEVKEITEKGVRCGTEKGEVFLEGDTVVVALGMTPLWDEADTLAPTAGGFCQVGDCRAPRDILAATGEAWTTAINLGRF
jgi:2,4-dienoyl-CoA reductase-like NADH-dependent reductase (Old Yellow Enzyme family)/NADPH-dependent 2,4-dienoyl-CoA reductase/sulfur reductase-like enzyme